MGNTPEALCSKVLFPRIAANGVPATRCQRRRRATVPAVQESEENRRIAENNSNGIDFVVPAKAIRSVVLAKARTHTPPWQWARGELHVRQ